MLATGVTTELGAQTVAPSFAYGAPQTRTVSESGATTTSFPAAAYDQVPNSSYPFTPTLGAEFSSRLATMASEARSRSETLANVASQSTSNAISRFRELRSQFGSSHGSETAQGNAPASSLHSRDAPSPGISSTAASTILRIGDSSVGMSITSSFWPEAVSDGRRLLRPR